MEEETRFGNNSCRVGHASPKELFDRGDMEGAIGLFETADPETLSIDEIRLWSDCLAAQRKYKEAAAILCSLQNMSPEDWVVAAWLNVLARDWNAARQSIEQAKSKAETGWIYYLDGEITRAGKLWLELNAETKDEIIELFRVATEYKDCPSDAFLEWAGGLCILSKWEQAREVLRRGVARHPTDSRLRLRLAELSLEDDPVETLSAVEPLLAQPTCHFDVLWASYRACIKTGDYSCAVALLKRLPEEALIRLQWCEGYALLGLDKVDEAILLFNNCVASADTDLRSVGLFCRAKARLSRGQVHLAVLDATRAVRENLDCGGGASEFYFSVPGSTYPVGTGDLVEIVCRELLASVKNAEWLLPASKGYLEYACCEAKGDLVQSADDIPAILESIRLTNHGGMYHLLLQRYGAENNAPGMVEAWLSYEEWSVQRFPNHITTPLLMLDEKRENAEVRGLHRIFLKRLLDQESRTVVSRVYAPIYRSLWRTWVIRLKAWQDMITMCFWMRRHVSGDKGITFDLAYAYHMVGNVAEAEAGYEEVLVLDPSDAATLHNIALIAEKNTGDFQRALNFYQRASQAEPDAKDYARDVERVQRRINELSLVTEQDSEILRTAPSRWTHLTPRQKDLLGVLAVTGVVDGPEALGKLSGISSEVSEGHWQTLLGLGMIIKKGARFAINPYVYAYAIGETAGSRIVQPSILKRDGPLKPVFNSRAEFEVYRELLTMFPNDLVIPNASLPVMFRYEHMKELLSRREFDYFVMAQVDFCITSTATYLPVLAVEVDGPHHQALDRKEKDAYKDRIFSIGGLPLIRISPHLLGPGQLRRRLLEGIQSALPDVRQVENVLSSRIRLELKGDLVGFGKTKD